MKERLSSSFKLTAIPKLTGVLRKNVKIGKGGNKALDPDEMRAWAFFAIELPAGGVFQSKIGGLSGYAQLTTDPSNIQAAVEEFQSPDVNAGEKATAAALGQRPKIAGSRAPAPGRTSIVVLNGNGITGSAANASYLLGRRGYRILPPPEGVLANAPSRAFRTSGLLRSAAARLAAAAAGGWPTCSALRTSRAMTPLIAPFANTAMLVVVVGADLPRHARARTCRPHARTQPPNVVRNPSATLGSLRAVRRKAGFPLMVLSLVERSSTVHYENGTRLYWMNKEHKAVRLRSAPAPRSTGASSRRRGTTRRCSAPRTSRGSSAAATSTSTTTARTCTWSCSGPTGRPTGS